MFKTTVAAAALFAGLLSAAHASDADFKLANKTGYQIDEVYVVAGHKGQPEQVAKRGGLDAAAGWQARRAAARWRRTSRPSSA